MGRPAKLTPHDLTQIQRRLLEGESAEKVAKDFGVSGAAIRKRFGTNQSVGLQSYKVGSAARMLAAAQDAIDDVPEAHRHVVFDLAASLRSTSASLARTAELSSRTAHRMASLANSQAVKVDDADPMKENSPSLNALKSVSTLTKMAIDASSIGLNLLSANKERMREGAPETPDPAALPANAVDAAAVYQRVMQGG
jgi:hypothetical protein